MIFFDLFILPKVYNGFKQRVLRRKLENVDFRAVCSSQGMCVCVCSIRFVWGYLLVFVDVCFLWWWAFIMFVAQPGP